jgi:hypothetical protein
MVVYLLAERCYVAEHESETFLKCNFPTLTEEPARDRLTLNIVHPPSQPGAGNNPSSLAVPLCREAQERVSLTICYATLWGTGRRAADVVKWMDYHARLGASRFATIARPDFDLSAITASPLASKSAIVLLKKFGGGRSHEYDRFLGASICNFRNRQSSELVMSLDPDEYVVMPNDQFRQRLLTVPRARSSDGLLQAMHRTLSSDFAEMYAAIRT